MFPEQRGDLVNDQYTYSRRATRLCLARLVLRLEGLSDGTKCLVQIRIESKAWRDDESREDLVWVLYPEEMISRLPHGSLFCRNQV